MIPALGVVQRCMIPAFGFFTKVQEVPGSIPGVDPSFVDLVSSTDVQV
jgi:hypothetical protein